MECVQPGCTTRVVKGRTGLDVCWQHRTCGACGAFGICRSKSRDDRFPGYWCGSCYQRWNLNGSPVIHLRKRAQSIEEYIEMYTSAPDERGCINWIGPITQGGYGKVDKRSHRGQAHRIVWEVHHGEAIPDDVHLLHECDNRICVNLGHLRLGSNGENMADKWSKVSNRRALAMFALKVLQRNDDPYALGDKLGLEREVVDWAMTNPHMV